MSLDYIHSLPYFSYCSFPTAGISTASQPGLFPVLPLLFAPSSPIPQCHLSQDRPRFSQDTSILSQTTPPLASLQASAYPSSSAQRPHSPAELALTHQPQAVRRVLRVAVHLGFLDSSHSVTTSRLCAFNPFTTQGDSFSISEGSFFFSPSLMQMSLEQPLNLGGSGNQPSSPQSSTTGC